MTEQAAVVPHRWTRAEYERMVDAGTFAPGARVELIDGEIVEMPPQKSLHSTGIRLVEEALRRVFSKGWDVRVQMPLALDERSEPEPDVVNDVADTDDTTTADVVDAIDDVAGSDASDGETPGDAAVVDDSDGAGSPIEDTGPVEDTGGTTDTGNTSDASSPPTDTTEPSDASTPTEDSSGTQSDS